MWEKRGLDSYRIAIYARESRDDNEENYDTIETQRDLLIDFVNRNKLGEIYKVYIDDNVSGTGFERNGLNQLKEDTRAGKVNLLLLKDLSRLGRNNAKTLLFLDFLEEYGVRVITFDGRYDSLRDNDTVGIDTWFNERYVRDISRKIRANLRFKIQKGEYIGHAPYGYQKSSKEKNKLEVEPNSAAVVKKIYSLYLDGYGYASIAEHLNDKGYLSPSRQQGTANASPKWNAVAVQRILTNRVYIGDTVQGVSEKISFKSKKTRRLPTEKWVITKNTHPLIISQEEFEKVQKLRSQKKTQSETHKGQLHAFKGLLTCGGCGSTLFARVRKGRPMAYICGNYGKYGTARCSSHHVGERELEEIVVKELALLLGDRKIRERVTRQLSSDMGEREAGLREIDRLEQQLIQKQKQQDVLYMDRLEGRVSDQLFDRMNQGLEQKIKCIKREIEELKHRKGASEDFEGVIEAMLTAFEKNGLQHEFMRLLVDRITVYDEKDDVTGLLPLCHGENSIQNTLRNGAIVVDFKFGKFENEEA